MITSSEFFKKTFFDLEFETPQDMKSPKKNHHFSQINKTVLNRYSEMGSFDQRNAENSSNAKISQKGPNNFSSTKNRFNDSYNQIQKYHSHRKNIQNPKELDQFTIDVTPWNQNNTSLTSRELYDSKHTLNHERQKIKSTISKYKFTRTIEESDKQHANFILKSPKKHKKINYILYEYANRKSKEDSRKKVNLIKNVDLNKSYEQYLNHEIEFDKDFLFKSHAKVKTHNKKQLSNSNKNVLSRDDKNRSLIEKKSSQKQFIDDVIKKDLVCSQIAEDLKQLKLDTLMSNQTNNKEQQSPGHGTRINEKNRLLDKGKILKFEMNRRIFKGNKISLSGVVPIINQNSLTQRQKFSFEVSGNKTRKLQYSNAVTD